MQRRKHRKKYGNFLLPTDIPEKPRSRRPEYMSPLYVRHSMELNASKRARKKSHFFDVEREYGDVLDDDSDSDLSDAFLSDSTYHASECGELTDQSEAEVSYTRRRQKKQVTKSNANTKHSLTESEDENTNKKLPRRKKSSIRDKNKTVSSGENNEHSWTDSGVSLSRTDYSRNGTLRETRSQKKLMHDYSLQKSRSGSDPSGRLVAKEKNDIRRRVFSHSDAKAIPVIKFDQRRNNLEAKINRFSFVTDRSSLTNVTNLSMNDLTAVSSESNGDVINDDVKPDKESSPLDVEVSKENTTQKKISVSAPNSDNEKNHCSISDKNNDTGTAEQFNKNDFVQSSEINSAVTSGNHEINIQINAILGNGYNKENESFDIETFNPNSDKIETRTKRKKSKSLMWGLKKAAVNLRPKFLRPHKKDLNSNIFEGNGKGNFHNESSIVHNKSVAYENVDKDEPIRYFNDVNNFGTLPSFTNRKQAKPKKLFDRIFSRSRSFSAEKIIQQKLTRKGSLPQNSTAMYNKAMFNQRSSKSMENIGIGANYYNRNSLENLRSFHDPSFITQQPNISRVHSLNQLNNFENIYTKTRANSTPTTPLLMHRNQNAPEMCNCEDCVYEEYLEYLAFQEFRKNKNRTQQIQHYVERDQSVHSLPYILHAPAPYAVMNESVVAPLNISHGQEKEAKTIRTSLYDTFV